MFLLVGKQEHYLGMALLWVRVTRQVGQNHNWTECWQISHFKSARKSIIRKNPVDCDPKDMSYWSQKDIVAAAVVADKESILSFRWIDHNAPISNVTQAKIDPATLY